MKVKARRKFNKTTHCLYHITQHCIIIYTLYSIIVFCSVKDMSSTTTCLQQRQTLSVPGDVCVPPGSAT